MARKIKTTKTAEQRRAEAQHLHDSITRQVEELRQTDAWTRFLQFAQAFHNYSLNNLLLILAQNPGATHVAGYRTWQNLGRQVRKGERGLRIFGGRDTTVTETDETTGEETKRRRTIFFPVSVFDISQTDPIDPDANTTPEIAHRLNADEPLGILQAVTDYLTAKGWTITHEAIPGEVNGYTTTDGTHRVAIEKTLAPAQAAKTALHEAAHVILHAEEDHKEYITHRGIKETEAESVAYIVAGILGLDTSAYSIGYVAGWSQCDTDLIKDTASNVLRAAHTLITNLTEEEQSKTAA